MEVAVEVVTLTTVMPVELSGEFALFVAMMFVVAVPLALVLVLVLALVLIVFLSVALAFVFDIAMEVVEVPVEVVTSTAMMAVESAREFAFFVALFVDVSVP